MMNLARLLRRSLSLALCAMLMAVPSLAQGIQFEVTLNAEPDACPAEHRELIRALDLFMEQAVIMGHYDQSGDSFLLDAQLQLGEGRTASRTELSLFGVSSHWGLTSPLLGKKELMINVAALLEFGLKMNRWLDLPAEKAALLAPYVHTDALEAPLAVVAPLFPAENGTWTFSYDQVSGMANEVIRLCDEDPAFSRWLEATGMYDLVVHCATRIIYLSILTIPGLTVQRTDTSLVWNISLFNVLTLQQTQEGVTLFFDMPTLGTANGELRMQNDTLQVDLALTIDGQCSADMSLSLPDLLSGTGAISASISATGDFLPDGALSLCLEGEADHGTLQLRLLDPDSRALMVSAHARLSPWTADPPPAYRVEDLNGMNFLSVTGDSLRSLLSEVQEPLLTGCYDLLVAAPAEGVQRLMDWAEDSGVLDLMLDSLAGGHGY